MFIVFEMYVEYLLKYIWYLIIFKKYNMNIVEYFVVIINLERLKFYFLNE